MGERVRVVRHDGRLLAVKEPRPGGEDALRAEAEVLDRMRTAGVVELVGLQAGEPIALLTRWVGPRSLADLVPPLAPERAAGLCLAVAGTLERLHRAGFVHGDLDPTHVLLDTHGRPVLCGFGSARPIGAPVRRPATDRSAPLTPGPRADAGPPASPADDVAGLGRLLLHLLGPACPGGLTPSARRSAARWKALRTVAEGATDTKPSARPSLSRVSRSIRRAVPDAALGADPPDELTRPAADDDPNRHLGAHRSSARRGAARPIGLGSAREDDAETRSPWSLAAALVAVVAVGATSYLGLSAWWSTQDPGPVVATETAGSDRTTPPPASPATTTSAQPTSAGPSPAPIADTTSIPSTTAVAAAPSSVGAVTPVLEHAGRRYAVGSTGDVVLVGPWRCDGSDLVALLRPSEGRVHVFDGWAAPGGSTTARAVATVSGATGLEAEPDGPGCAALAVTGPTGVLTTLTAEDLG